ncbi:Os06g0497275, partial [Oryza sativa Japonica Group]
KLGELHKWNSTHIKVLLPPSSEAHSFRHVQIAGENVFRKTPVKIKQKTCESKLHISKCKIHSRANSSPSTKRYELEVVAFVFYCTTLKPIWHELLWFIPNLSVPANSPYIHDYSSSLGYVIAEYLTLLLAFPW